MATYRAIGISIEEATRLRNLLVDDFGYPVERLFNDDQTYPCRFTLKQMPATNGMLLLAYQTPLPRSAYGHSTAIFLSASGGDAFSAIDTVPEIVSSRSVSLRAFNADGKMLYDANTLVDDNDHDGAIRRVFSRDDVAYINVHTTKPGCFLCHIQRA